MQLKLLHASSALLVVWVLICPAALLGSQAPTGSSLSGTLLFPDGSPAANVEVILVGSGRRTLSDASGRFEFRDLPPGRYTLQAASPGTGRAVASLELGSSDKADLRLVLESQLLHRDTITVTAAPLPSLLSEVAQPVAVLSDQELLAVTGLSLGDTLSRLPGVSTTYFGPGSGRPILRGLGGDRIRILDQGLGLGDVSSTSPDHAVAFDPLATERIEVVRGPATLLYGSSAVGGVVNLLDESIPERLPTQTISGSVTLLGGLAAEEKSGAFSLLGKAGSLAWTANFSRRDAGDTNIPGFAESDAAHEAHEHDHEEERISGTLPNSFVESRSGRLGLSWIGTNGFFGVSAFGFDTRYGIPGEAHAHGYGDESEPGGEEAVSIDLEQRRLDFRGEIALGGAFERLKLRAGAYDYTHRELEGEEEGTRFDTDGLEGRFELLHRKLGPFRGAVGLQVGERDFVATGEEAFVPTNSSRSVAFFFVEELTAGNLAWELGGRFERQRYEVERAGLPDRSFSGVSASTALRFKITEGLITRFSLSRTETIPNPEALYADGPHAATRTFEIGNPNLGKETSLAFDAGVRFEGERIRFDVAGFLHRVDRFILERFTGEEEDGFAVVEFSATDAELRGFEADLHLELLHRHPQHLELHLSADAVRAEERASGSPLPRIPPLRYGAALEYRGERWFGTLSGQRVERQRRLAPFETATDGYTWLEASMGYRLLAGRTVHDLILTGRNLTDSEARVHSSYLKDLAPLPGRDWRLAYRLGF